MEPCGRPSESDHEGPKSLSDFAQDLERNKHKHNMSFMALSGIVVEGCCPSLSRKVEVSLCPFIPLDIVGSVTICVQNSEFADRQINYNYL